MLKKLFYASASVLMLALAYHLGARSATAQAGVQVSGFAVDGGFGMLVMTPNGDIFTRFMACGNTPGPLCNMGNFWSGGPTPAAQQTWGRLKAQYRK